MTDPDIAAVRDFMLEGGDEPAAIAALARVEARLNDLQAIARSAHDTIIGASPEMQRQFLEGIAALAGKDATA